jgi:hypothetical protein
VTGDPGPAALEVSLAVGAARAWRRAPRNPAPHGPSLHRQQALIRYWCSDLLLVQIGQEPLERSRSVMAAALQATAVPQRPVPAVTRRHDPSLPVLLGC